MNADRYNGLAETPEDMPQPFTERDCDDDVPRRPYVHRPLTREQLTDGATYQEGCLSRRQAP